MKYWYKSFVRKISLAVFKINHRKSFNHKFFHLVLSVTTVMRSCAHICLKRLFFFFYMWIFLDELLENYSVLENEWPVNFRHSKG